MTKKKTVAIVSGGDNVERVISLKSAELLQDQVDPETYRLVTIDMKGSDWNEVETNTPVDKNNFTLSLKGETIVFDGVYVMIHGSPAEDGLIQGYLELMGLPYTCCDTFTSALTFDKQATKDLLSTYEVPMAPSTLLKERSEGGDYLIDYYGLPLFVKPNKQGSSFGVTKVKKSGELMEAIEKAFEFDDEVIIEPFLDGVEFSCGALTLDGETVVFPATEIIPETEFFDYAAKYEKASEEITPGRIDEDEMEDIRSQTKYIYNLLNCRGMVRVDYIKVNDVFYFLEVNTIPGLSETSIIPQQAVAHGWTIRQLVEAPLEEMFRE